MSVHRLFPTRRMVRLTAVAGLILLVGLAVRLATDSTRQSGSARDASPASVAGSPGSSSGSAGSSSGSAGSSSAAATPSYAPVVNRPAPIIHVPPGAGAGKLPLVIALHGGLQTPHVMEASTDLDQVADAHGFIIAYLGSPAPEWQHSNDLAYIGSMITWLTSHYSVDPSRVYVVGFSLGGYATFRTVCQYSNRLAGIAVVSQVMAPLSRRPCKLSRPVSQLAIVGSKDAVPLHASAAKPVSADQTATIWRGLDGCSTKSVTSQSPPVLQTVWSQCTDGTKVGEYVVQGGVHTWPLNRPALATRSPDYRYNASAALWSFLSPLRASPNTVDAQLLSLTVTGSAGHRSLVVRVRSGEQLSFKQTLSLRRHVLAVKRYRLGAGPQVRATSRIPRYLKAGRYAVTLSAIDGYGRKLNLVRTIRVPG